MGSAVALPALHTYFPYTLHNAPKFRSAQDPTDISIALINSCDIYYSMQFSENAKRQAKQKNEVRVLKQIIEEIERKKHKDDEYNNMRDLL